MLIAEKWVLSADSLHSPPSNAGPSKFLSRQLFTPIPNTLNDVDVPEPLNTSIDPSFTPTTMI